MHSTDKTQAEKPTCCGDVWLSYRWVKCTKTGKVERDGKHYCGIHDPVAIKAKKDKQHAKWKQEWDAEAAANKAKAAAAAEQKRRADCYDDLLGALQAAIDCGMVPTTSAKEGGASKFSQQVVVADMIRAAIAKAVQP